VDEAPANVPRQIRVDLPKVGGIVRPIDACEMKHNIRTFESGSESVSWIGQIDSIQFNALPARQRDAQVSAHEPAGPSYEDPHRSPLSRHPPPVGRPAEQDQRNRDFATEAHGTPKGPLMRVARAREIIPPSKIL
jgi:hypothetical protein